MRAAGYVEGTNLVVEYRYAQGELQQMPALATELVSLNPDCLVATGLDAIRGFRRATSTIPIVIGALDADPVKEGLVTSLARPGGNITGVIGIAWELAGKRLEILRQIAPKTVRVAVLLDPQAGAASDAHLKAAEAAARRISLQLQVLEVKEPSDLENAFRAARANRADALFVITPGMLNSHRRRVIALANEIRLPAMYSNLEFPREGGLVGYAPNVAEQFRRVATYVDKILNGARPGDLAIEQPTAFELVINVKAAKGIGLTISRSVLARADQVID